MGSTKRIDLLADNHKGLKWLLFFVLLATSFQPTVGVFGANLDPSWCFAINWFFDKGVTFGRDVFFTYGPLGFLCSTRNVGHNVVIALAFWCAVSLALAALLWQVLFKIEYSAKWQLPLAILFYVAARSVVGAEYFLYYVFFLALLLSVFSNYKNIIVCDVLLIVVSLVKFSLFIGVLSGVVLFVALAFALKLPHAKRLSLHLAASLVLSSLAYMIYARSPSAYIGYIKGALEVSAGYSVAMSLFTQWSVNIIWVVLAAVLYLALLLASFKNKRNFFLLCMFLGPAFMVYKHGFVRADGHVNMTFAGMIWIFSLIFLFFDFGSSEEAVFASLKLPKFTSRVNAFVLIMAIMAIALVQRDISPSSIIADMNERSLDMPRNLGMTLYRDRTIDQNQLPDEVRQRVKSSTVTIFPWNILCIRHLDCRYVPFPAVQNYNAYTPWLDSQDAAFFAGEEAPEYIVMTLESLDGRWPLLETPATWMAIAENYCVDYVQYDWRPSYQKSEEYDLYEPGLFLLKKQLKPETFTLQESGSFVMRKNDRLDIPPDSLVQIDARLSLLGKALKLLWQVPAVKMEVEYQTGEKIAKRILLDNLKNAVDLSSVPHDSETFVDYIEDEGAKSRVKAVSFQGVGLWLYKGSFRVTVYSKQ